MAMHYKKEIISPEVLQELYPLTPEQKKQKQIRDQQIKEIITGESDKFLVIIGPCSADHEDSVCEYITRLAKVQERIQEKVLIVPRIYTNKPRTTGEGYKGIVHQPDPEKGEDFMEGLIAMRLKCTSVLFPKPVSLQRTKCFILKTGHTSAIFYLMLLLVPAR